MNIDDKTKRTFKLKDLDFGICFKFSNVDTTFVSKDWLGRYYIKVEGKIVCFKDSLEETITEVANNIDDILAVDLSNGKFIQVFGEAMVKPLRAKVEVRSYD